MSAGFTVTSVKPESLPPPKSSARRTAVTTALPVKLIGLEFCALVLVVVRENWVPALV